MKKLTQKQKGFVQDLIATGNEAEAAARNFNVKSRQNASSCAHQLLKKPHIKAELARLMEDYDITEDYLMQKAKEGLEAKVIAKKGNEVQETELPDHNVRHKYWQDMCKINKLFPAQQIEQKNVNIDLEIEKMPKEEFKKLLKEAYAS